MVAASCRDSGDLGELRGRIIQIFFKHLTSSNEVAVAMSQEGLAAVIAHQKMPKQLLQVYPLASTRHHIEPLPPLQPHNAFSDVRTEDVTKYDVSTLH